MNIFERILNFFRKTKNTIEIAKDKLETFIELHRGNIKVLMNIFQAIYDKSNGNAKMQQVVKTVCSAVGAEEFGNEYADDIAIFVEEKCQQIYDELVAEGGLEK